MRRGIFANPNHIDGSNVDQLRDMEFIFLCVDKGGVKKLIIEKLEEWNTGFIDVGIGVEKYETSLTGILRVTTSTPAYRKHVRTRVSFADDDPNGEYNQNIQIADLMLLTLRLQLLNGKNCLVFMRI